VGRGAHGLGLCCGGGAEAGCADGFGEGGAPLFLTTDRIAADTAAPASDPARTFAACSAQVEAIAATLKIDTPDEYANSCSAAIGIAAETIWDAKQQCVMHGGVAWRVPLAGWRGPYNLDALGNHDRAVLHFQHWLKRQNVTPVTTADPAIGPWDPNIHLARKEGMLHSNGDVSNNHYDMNMVFIDALLRHYLLLAAPRCAVQPHATCHYRLRIRTAPRPRCRCATRRTGGPSSRTTCWTTTSSSTMRRCRRAWTCSGKTRILDPVAFHGKGRTVPGGSATILHLPLDATKDLASLELRVELYGIVVALMGATLDRSAALRRG
jgi:hypothetical protein